MRCTAIKSGGERCKLEATHGSYCWSHAPETADKRSRRASRGGSAGGNGRPGGGEVSEIRALLKDLLDGVQEHRVNAGVAAVCTQLINARIRLIETERRVREQEEVIERIEQLEVRTGARRGPGSKPR